jgi:hypothetical protein
MDKWFHVEMSFWCACVCSSHVHKIAGKKRICQATDQAIDAAASVAETAPGAFEMYRYAIDIPRDLNMISSHRSSTGPRENILDDIPRRRFCVKQSKTRSFPTEFASSIRMHSTSIFSSAVLNRKSSKTGS